MKTRHLLLLFVALLPIAAWAGKYTQGSVNYEYDTSSGTASVSKSSNAWGNITILSSFTVDGKDYSVTSIGDNAFQNCFGLTSVTIPNSVTSIGAEAFRYCWDLTSITIPSSVTSIGSNAFEHCSGLTSIKVESSNTFYDSRDNCNAIIVTETNKLISGCKNTTIPNSVTSIGQDAFSYCSGLTSITIPNSVTSIGRAAFWYCSGLTSIVIPNSVTSIEEIAFSGCSRLTSIVVESGNTIYDSRNNCNAIIKTKTNELISGCKNSTIPNSVTSIGYGAFWYCSGLTSITIPNSVTSIRDDAFSGCSGLTSITIPKSVTSIGGSAFYGCSGLTEVRSLITEPFTINTDCWYGVNEEIPLYVPIGTKALYEATAGWKGFTNIIEMEDGIPTGNIVFADANVKAICIANWDTDGDGELSYDEAAAVTNIGEVFQFSSIKSFEELQYFTGLTNIEESTFTRCNGLTSIILPQNVKSIGDETFYQCFKLASITIPDGVTTIGEEAFYECSSLTSLTIPRNVTTIGKAAFRFCYNLTSIVVDSGNMYYDSREGCNAIIRTSDNELILGCMNTTIPYGVTKIGFGAFSDCRKLTSITIPNSVTTIGEYAFEDCEGLTSFTIPNSVTLIEKRALTGCEGLTSLTIPNSVTSIGGYAFKGCSRLTSVSIPNSLTTLSERLFLECSSLTSITIPNSVNKIERMAFCECDNLRDVYCYAETVPNTASDAFEYSPIEKMTLHVLSSSIEAYKAEVPWNRFKEIVAIGLKPINKSDNVDYAEDGDITENTDLSGTVVNNMFYNIGTDAGGYSAEEGCIVITKETSDEQMELLQGLGISDEELQKNFTGIIFKVPAGEGTVKVTAETTGNMTLKVKVGNGKAMKMELSGKLKMEFPYEVNEESLVYIFAGTTDESGVRGATATEPSSLKIYGIEWSSSSPKGDLNGDGKVNVGDIMAVINVMAGVGGEAEKAAADVNEDGKVNVGDIMAVINIMAGK